VARDLAPHERAVVAQQARRGGVAAALYEVGVSAQVGEEEGAGGRRRRAARGGARLGGPCHVDG